MNVVLVPGLLGKAELLGPLQERLEAEGFQCWGPGFHTNLLFRGELALLRRRVHRLAPCILVGHSAGGYLALRLAREPNSGIVAVVGLGTLPIVRTAPPVPYFEGRSIWEALLPSVAGETKRFLSLHTGLPFMRSVQDWVVQKVKEVTDANERTGGKGEGNARKDSGRTGPRS